VGGDGIWLRTKPYEPHMLHHITSSHHSAFTALGHHALSVNTGSLLLVPKAK